MILGTIGVSATEPFTVTDGANNLVSGIPTSAFSVDLLDPRGVNVKDEIVVDMEEYVNGHYKASFIPNRGGTWYLVIYHPVYFPWGKADDIQVYKSDFNQISDDLLEVLGLVHSNIFIDNPIYDGDNNLTSARVRIYSNTASVGTTNDIIGTYEITAPGNGAGKFTSWKQVKV